MGWDGLGACGWGGVKTIVASLPHIHTHSYDIRTLYTPTASTRPPQRPPTCASIHASSASASPLQLMLLGPGRVASNLLGSSSARGR
jgi:hypothetical protein